VLWDALADIAEECGASVDDLVTRISRSHDAPNLSAGIRGFIVEFYRSRQQ
jgi:predicted DNA-binding ribbon-helix-helix protein